MTNSSELIADKLISAKHIDGTLEREDTQTRHEAAERQTKPITEWRNPDQMKVIKRPGEVKGDTTRDYIESLKRSKGLKTPSSNNIS